MMTPEQARAAVRAAMELIIRRKTMIFCVKCGEETPAFAMSKGNPMMCADCWAIYDMDRFTEFQPGKKEGEDDDRANEETGE